MGRQTSPARYNETVMRQRGRWASRNVDARYRISSVFTIEEANRIAEAMEGAWGVLPALAPYNRRAPIVVLKRELRRGCGRATLGTFPRGWIKLGTGWDSETVIHELGHILGIGHSTDENDIMYSPDPCPDSLKPWVIKKFKLESWGGDDGEGWTSARFVRNGYAKAKHTT